MLACFMAPDMFFVNQGTAVSYGCKGCKQVIFMIKYLNLNSDYVKTSVQTHKVQLPVSHLKWEEEAGFVQVFQ